MLWCVVWGVMQPGEMVRQGLTEKMTFEKRPEVIGTQAKQKSFQGRRNRKCKQALGTEHA